MGTVFQQVTKLEFSLDNSTSKKRKLSLFLFILNVHTKTWMLQEKVLLLQPMTVLMKWWNRLVAKRLHCGTCLFCGFLFYFSTVWAQHFFFLYCCHALRLQSEAGTQWKHCIVSFHRTKLLKETNNRIVAIKLYWLFDLRQFVEKETDIFVQTFWEN